MKERDELTTVTGVPADKTSSNNKMEALEYTARASETENSVKLRLVMLALAYLVLSDLRKD